jgi:hypothetical protein
MPRNLALWLLSVALIAVPFDATADETQDAGLPGRYGLPPAPEGATDTQTWSNDTACSTYINGVGNVGFWTTGQKCMAWIGQINAMKAAQEKPSPEITECTNEAVVFNFAAMFRDTGISPQQTLSKMRAQPSLMKGFPDGLVKNIIDVVYFDPDASKIPYGQMYSAIVHSCMSRPKKFQPLN